MHDAVAALNSAGQWLASDPQRACRLMASGLLQMPDSAVAWFNYGLAQHLSGKPSAAVRAYRLSLRCEQSPRRQVANNLSQDLLLSACFAEGWEAYEQRPEQPLPMACEQWYGPRWRGGSLEEKPLLIVSEQGFGDTLMMLRFVLNLLERGIPVELVCQRALVELIRHAAPSIPVHAGLVREPHPRTWVPLLSLPRLFGATDQAMPLRQGYLDVSPALVRSWSQRLGRQPGKRLVALHWQGNPSSEQTLYSRGRSMALGWLEPLAAMPDLEFVSVQKGQGSDQWPGPFAACQVAGQAAVSASCSFLDTAAVLANCDLLISADSAVVHLAGALGLPAWVLLKAIPEWRWGLSGERSYWYDSLRLFRQKRSGSWREPLQQICRVLNCFNPLQDAASRMDWDACRPAWLPGCSS